MGTLDDMREAVQRRLLARPRNAKALRRAYVILTAHKLAQEIAAMRVKEMLPDQPSARPCYQINPALWAEFCRQKNRPALPSDLWTEADVVQALDENLSYGFQRTNDGPLETPS